jgi:ABC-type uncharacterized transport system ATPase component
MELQKSEKRLRKRQKRAIKKLEEESWQKQFVRIIGKNKMLKNPLFRLFSSN